MQKLLKIQAAVDFLLSYGIAMLMIGIAIEVMYSLGVLNTSLIPASCSGTTSFSCGSFFLSSTSGALTLTLSQDSGGPITINGVSCSNQKNTTGDKPKYGNVYVTNNPSYYPTGDNPGGNVIYSAGTYTFVLNCYGSAGVATGTLGRAFSGYIWLNYT